MIILTNNNSKFFYFHNYFILILLFYLLCFNYSYALEEKQNFEAEDMEIIIDKYDELSNKINELENKLNHVSDPEEIKDNIDYLQENLNDQQAILTNVERQTLIDSINIGAELTSRFNWFDFKGYDYAPFTGKKLGNRNHEKVNLISSNRLKLNLNTSYKNIVKFTACLSMYKNWSDDDYPIYPVKNFLNNARIPSDISLNVERAYFDYFFEGPYNIPMALTFGKVPTTDGLPADLKENTPRKSTYPGLAYDCETDGIALSFDLKKLTKLNNSAFRFVWLRRFDDNETYVLQEKVSDKFGDFRVDENAMDVLDIFIAQFEAMMPSPFENTLFILNWLNIPDAPPSDLRYNSNLKVFYDQDNPSLFVDVPKTEGSLNKLTLLFESKKFLNSFVDCFVHLSYMKTKAKGALKFMFNPSSIGLPGEPILARYAFNTYQNTIKELPALESALKSLQNAPEPIGLLNNDGISNRDAFAFHLGLRINLPFILLKEPKLGIEFNKASRYWFGINNGSVDPLHKFDIRGKVWDFYYIQPITKSFILRLGYIFADYDYDEGLSFYHGNPLEIDHEVINTYFLLNARF